MQFYFRSLKEIIDTYFLILQAYLNNVEEDSKIRIHFGALIKAKDNLFKNLLLSKNKNKLEK